MQIKPKMLLDEGKDTDPSIWAEIKPLIDKIIEKSKLVLSEKNKRVIEDQKNTNQGSLVQEEIQNNLF